MKNVHEKCAQGMKQVHKGMKIKIERYEKSFYKV